MLAQLDPARLLWMKNVNHPHPERWAYFRGHEEDPPVPSPPRQADFRMHWAKGDRGRASASRPQLGDVMLLCQRGRATHLVRFMDGGPLEDRAFPNHPWRRSVAAGWFADPATAPGQEDVLGFDPYFRNGFSRRIDTCEGYRTSRWPGNGGLPALQQHIISLVSSSGRGPR